MSHAIQIQQTGGPEVLQWTNIEVGTPGPGQVRLKQTAVGVNFIDVYHRTGLYPQPLPFVPGMEGAGTVESVGSGVTHLKAGDRVAYAMVIGGVGLIICQWAAALGATVIGTVSNDEKAALARANGCHHTIVYTREDFQKRLLEITGGEKLPVVYDSVGKNTFMKSLDCLRPRGMMVLFGASLGPVPPLDLSVLAQKGSLLVTRPTLANFVATRPLMEENSADLFNVVGSGKVNIHVNQNYPLKEAAKAHRDLEARKTTGSTILTV